MKRFWILLVFVLVVALGLVLALSGSGKDPAAPRFVRGAPASVPQFTWNHYEWDAEVPFEGGKMWLWVAAGTNHHAYLYDLQQRVISGELLHGSAELAQQDNSKIMCQGPDALSASLKQQLMDFLRKITRGKIAQVNRTETFWILDIHNNSSTRIGAVSQFPGAGSRWHRSPSSRYGYTTPTGARGRFFVFMRSGQRLRKEYPNPRPTERVVERP